jgi:hypothetical protein
MRNGAILIPVSTDTRLKDYEPAFLCPVILNTIHQYPNCLAGSCTSQHGFAKHTSAKGSVSIPKRHELTSIAISLMSSALLVPLHLIYVKAFISSAGIRNFVVAAVSWQVSEEL